MSDYDLEQIRLLILKEAGYDIVPDYESLKKSLISIQKYQNEKYEVNKNVWNIQKEKM